MTALCALHNFIRFRDPSELRDYDNVSQSYDECFGVAVDVPQADLGGSSVSVAERNQAEVFRNEVAAAMWTQYQGELEQRRQNRAAQR